MKRGAFTNFLVVLFLGDALTLAAVTVFGFASHQELNTAGWHMFTTYLPLLFAWLLVAPHLGVFTVEQATQARRLWRPFWAMLLAAPLAAWLRAVWLQQPVQPVFVAVIGGISALALLAWRVVYLLSMQYMRRSHG